MGRLIPAGTGYKFYRNVELKEEELLELDMEASEMEAETTPQS